MSHVTPCDAGTHRACCAQLLLCHHGTAATRHKPHPVASCLQAKAVRWLCHSMQHNLPDLFGPTSKQQQGEACVVSRL